MQHTTKWAGVGLALLTGVGTSGIAQAQTTVIVPNFRAYDSLTDLTEVSGVAQTGTTDVTATTTANPAFTQRGAQKSSGAGAYSALFGTTFATNGTGTSTATGLLSTSLVTDDLYLRINSTPSGPNNASFGLNTFRVLLTNENASLVNVTANIRFFADDGTRAPGATGGERGGFAGTLLHSAQQSVALNVGSSTTPNVTQVEFDFSSSPLLFSDFGDFSGPGYYEDRIWVGLFLTADAAFTTTTQLNNVGSIVYDTNLAARDNSPFESDATGGQARSTDQFVGDDTGNIAGNSPYNTSLNRYNNINETNANAFDDDRQDLPGAAQYRVAGGLNGTTDPDGTGPLLAIGPDANLAFFFRGDATSVIVPEPGSFGLALAGILPLVAVVVRRRAAK